MERSVLFPYRTKPFSQLLCTVCVHSMRSAGQRQWEFQQKGQMLAKSLTWGSTPLGRIADAQAMDRQYDGSWGTDLVGCGRLAAVAKDGQG